MWQVDGRGDDDAHRVAVDHRVCATVGAGAGRPLASSAAAFTGGYFVVWLGYSVAAALLQLAVGRLGVDDAIGRRPRRGHRADGGGRPSSCR